MLWETDFCLFRKKRVANEYGEIPKKGFRVFLFGRLIFGSADKMGISKGWYPPKNEVRQSRFAQIRGILKCFWELALPIVGGGLFEKEKLQRQM